jgi:hypothetical protein
VIELATQMGQTALVYAQTGWRVFPLWWTIRGGYCACPRGNMVNHVGAPACSRGKHPITATGVKEATDDVGQIVEWWTRYPWANIGLPASQNGLAIVDVDPAHGGQGSWDRLVAWAAKQGVDLTDTLLARTGSGGLHAFYAAPVGEHAASCLREGCQGCIRNGQGNRPPFGPDMPGLDTRGHGGYVVAAPSRHASGREYEWLNLATHGDNPQPWPNLLSRLMNPPKPPATQPARQARTLDGQGKGYAAATMAKVIDTVRGTGEGGRNAALFHASARLAELVAAGQLDEATVRSELESAAHAIGLDASETQKTIESGMRRHGAQGAAA